MKLEWLRRAPETSNIADSGGDCFALRDVFLPLQDAEKKGQHTKATNLITQLKRSKTDHEANIHKMKMTMMQSRFTR